MTEIKHYRWRCLSYNGEWYWDVYINADGSLHNPRGYPESVARAAALQADEHKHQQLIEARKRGVETRKRRKEERIHKIARDYLLGKHIGNRTECRSCKKPLSDPVSIARAIGSECWPRLMDCLAQQIPKCEQEIARCREQIAELKKQDLAYWEEEARQYTSDYSYRDRDGVIYRRATWNFNQTLERIRSNELAIADAEILLAAAQRWRQSNAQQTELTPTGR